MCILGVTNLKKRYKRRLTPVQTLALGFFIVIMVGTMLLMLPIASKSGVITPFVDAFFTSTSAVCITGLTTLNTAGYWSYFGTTIIIILIQVGGLGFMSFTTLIALLLGKRITLK
ncbi:potassium transporter TrkG, partial [Clostridium haemolyticum]